METLDPAAAKQQQAPSNDDIEAVIQLATASSTDGRPIKDTRTQLFVGNLPYRVRWQDLKDLFRKAGTVLRADVSLGPDNRSRGYGTVLLATAEDAGRAIDMFNGYSWQTRILEVRPDRLPPEFDHPGLLPDKSFGMPIPHSPSRTTMTPDLDYNSLLGMDRTFNNGRNLFVGNLPFHCQWQDLKDLFRQAGTVLRADVAMGSDGRSRGFGTVLFATDYDAERAVKMFNGYEYNGRVLKVHYDRFTASSVPATTPASPILPSYHSVSSLRSPSPLPGQSRPNQIIVPIGYTLDYGPLSAPSSPYDPYPPSLHRPPGNLVMNNQLTNLAARRSPKPQDVDPLADLLSSVHLPSQRTSSSSTGSSTDSKASVSATSSSSLSSNTTSPSDHSPSLSQSTPQNQSSSSHPNHPGPISIPPLQPAFAVPIHNISPGIIPMMSPVYHPVNMSPFHHPAQAVAGMMTPHGIPITPSMPPFTFSSHLHPMPSPTTSMFPASTSMGAMQAAPPVETPTHAPAAAVPVTPFSPGVALSPGALWGRPGAAGQNPFINPAVGAPVHLSYPPPGGDGVYYAPQPQTEPGGYFDQLFMVNPGSGGEISLDVEKDILKEKKDEHQERKEEDQEKESKPLELDQTKDEDKERHTNSSPSSPTMKNAPQYVMRADSDPAPAKTASVNEVVDKHEHVKSR